LSDRVKVFFCYLWLGIFKKRIYIFVLTINVNKDTFLVEILFGVYVV
jgi:hypothetical protein